MNDILERVRLLVKARYPVLQLVTHEEQRVERAVAAVTFIARAIRERSYWGTLRAQIRPAGMPPARAQVMPTELIRRAYRRECLAMRRWSWFTRRMCGSKCVLLAELRRQKRLTDQLEECLETQTELWRALGVVREVSVLRETPETYV